MPRKGRHPFALALIVSSTALGMAGTDLVLPAVPSLPGLLGGTMQQSQFVLASFTAGAAGGLLLFGELGAKLNQRHLLGCSLLIYSVVSALCAQSTSLRELIGLRFLQGAAGSAAAVFAPGMLRALYADERALRAIGLLGSVESLIPALAPIAGLWLLQAFGWTGSFNTLAALAIVFAVILWFARSQIPVPPARRASGSYARLLGKWAFVRQALSHACTLGALLVFVFGAPTVFKTALHGTLKNFVWMQISGISLFIIAANLVGVLSRCFGADALIRSGTLVAAAGASAMLMYAACGGDDVVVVTVFFLPLNLGLGLRGPPGFHAALVATEGDDARGAAAVGLAILLLTAGGTALVAPFILHGLISIAAAAAVLAIAAVAVLEIG